MLIIRLKILEVKEENNVSNDGNTAEDNDSELFKLLKDASDSNMSYAQFKLGTMYFNGKGVEVNYDEAYKWF